MTKYLFRMDDICPTMDAEKFAIFEKIFLKYDIKPLIGIIPENNDPILKINNSDPTFWVHMRSLVKKHGWEVAQHGYQHIYHTNEGGILNLNKNSETSGLSYQEQLILLTKGKEILHSEGLVSNIYMAPSHSYDLNTLKALSALEFEYVTDGYSLYPYCYKGLTFVPCQIANPREMPFGVYTFCIHANTATVNLVNKFEKFIQNNIVNIINFSEAKRETKSVFIQSVVEKTALQIRRIIKPIN
jgi:predicted deacetylase